jgi:hypothetical protein
VRLRLEGGVQCSPDPPSRRRLQRLLRMRPSETIGITARDTLSRHGRACPGHPDAVRCRASGIGITGTSPVMTAEGAVGECQGGTAQAEPGA